MSPSLNPAPVARSRLDLTTVGGCIVHCVGKITKAVKSEDPKAKVEIDLPRRLVKVESALSQDDIARQIAEAGYSPVLA